MDLTPYVANLRRELATAAEAGGEDTRTLAERLTAPLESAVRLTLLDALATAADEITRDLAPGSVELRLRGREPGFVVTAPPSEASYRDIEDDVAAASTPTAPEPLADLDEGAMARLNVRLPEQLKARIEEAAAREKISANVWLVRTATAALSGGRNHVANSVGAGGATGRRVARGGQSLIGWVR